MYKNQRLVVKVKVMSMLTDTHTPESECPDLDSVSVSDTNTTPTPMPTPSASRSELKLSLVQSSDDSSSDDSEVSDCDQEENCEDQSLSGSRIIDMTILSDNIKSQLVCKLCKGNVQLKEFKSQGLGSTLQFACVNNCNTRPFTTCATEGELKTYSVSKRAVFAMRCKGGDSVELQTFDGIMDILSKLSWTNVIIINSKSGAADHFYADSTSAANKI